MPNTSDHTTKTDIKDLKEELITFRDEVLTRFDGIMRELETMREENTLGVHQTSELWEKVDHHEKRITKLEAA